MTPRAGEPQHDDRTICHRCGWDPTWTDAEGRRVQPDHYCVPEVPDEPYPGEVY